MKHLRSGHSHEDIDQCFGSAAFFLVKNGAHLETPDDFEKLLQKYVDSAPRPHEPHRVVIRFDGHRPCLLDNCVVLKAQQPRKEFLSLAVPAQLTGMGGPGAPHQFDVTRREELGALVFRISVVGVAR